MKPALHLGCVVVLFLVAFNGGDLTTSASRALDIPSVEHCALVANPAVYDGKEIRVRGVYFVCGTNDSRFFSSSCSDGKTLWVEFNPSYQSCSKPKAVKSLTEMTRKSGVRWGRPHVSVVVLDYRSAEVEFVGKFTASNPFTQLEAPQTEGPLGPIRPNRESYDFVFNVSCVERVRPLPKGAKY